jgi:hypothetical protein
MLEPYSKAWDVKVNRLLDNITPKISNRNLIDGCYYRLYFQETTLWIQNYPYSYGVEYTLKFGKGVVRPSRLTILKLRKIEKELIAKLWV